MVVMIIKKIKTVMIKMSRTRYLSKTLNNGSLATLGDGREEIQNALEHRASFFCYEKLGKLL